MFENVLSKNKVLRDIEAALKAKPFVPLKLFSNQHAQTLLSYVYPRRRLQRSLKFAEKRLFHIEPNVQILAHCQWQPGERASKPTLLLVHGLEGSSDSIYMGGTAATAFAKGFNVLRLNLRTCGQTEHLTDTLYHSGMSADLAFVIRELIERDKLEHVFLAGFSLGGNLSLKLAGELSSDAPDQLRGVCAVSPSIDLAACTTEIEKPSNWIYNQRFVSSLKARLRRVQKLNPHLYSIENLAKVRTVYDFDTHFTAPYHNFLNTADYYERSSAHKLLGKIVVPTLIIQAQDDPFVPFASFQHPSLAANKNIILLAPTRGGHVGFVAADSAFDPNRFWAENRIIEFCALLFAASKSE